MSFPQEEISRSQRVDLSFIKKTSSIIVDAFESTYRQLKRKISAIKAKHIPLYLLAVGASLSIGLLSFGGMFALWPLLPLAFVAFALSVGYEGEIYVQNIKGSFKKSKANYLERKLAKECLLHDFKYTSGNDCPEFFKQYDALCAALEPFQHKNLDSDSKERKKLVEKKLSDMEKWFAQQLFSGENDKETVNQKAVRSWVKNKQMDQQESLASKWQKIKAEQAWKFSGAKVFCVLAAIMMGAGTTYLLVGTFALIPFLAAVPITVVPMLILPMAFIAGLAYYRLIHNALTDMISDKILVTWYQKIKSNFEQEKRIRGIFIFLGLTVFLSLTVLLSVCTAGTWWTVAKTTPALFSWMRRMPGFIMLVLNPVVSSLSTLLFNIQNISDTSKQADEATQGIDSLIAWLAAWFTMHVAAIQEDFHELRAKENWLQIFNPVRLLVNVLYTPLRFLAFLGHILSIGVTSDRVAGVSPIMSGALGAVNEGVEDIHYFVGHDGMGTCDLVSTDSALTDNNINDLKMISNAAFVRVKCNGGLSSLYYVNKTADKQCIEIKMEENHLAQFDATLKPVNKIRMLSSRQLKLIEGLLPAHSLHNHDPESLRRERLSGEHGHTHEDDIPTKILDAIFWLPRRCAAGLDSYFSRWNIGTAREVLDYNSALDKQLGRVVEESVEFNKHSCFKDDVQHEVKRLDSLFDPQQIKKKKKKRQVASESQMPWQVEHAVYLIDRHIEKRFKDAWFDSPAAKEQIIALNQLQSDLCQDYMKTQDGLVDGLIKLQVENSQIFKTQKTNRFFLEQNSGKTATQMFLEKLPDRVARIA